MDSRSNSKQKWKYFLSSIEHFKHLPTNNLKIKTKSNIGCLATKFANKLLQKETGKEGDLDVSKNQTETPIIKEKNETIDNIDEPTGPQDRRELFSVRAVISESSDDDKRENLLVDQTEKNEHVKETSAQNADDNIPEVPQIDTDEDVNEASAQFADANIKEEFQIYETSKLIEALVGNKPLASGKPRRRRHSNKHTPSKKCHNPSSRWNISNIAEYFIFDECVTKFELPTTYAPCSDDTYEIVQNDICRRLKMVKGIDLKAKKRNADSELLMQLKSITSTEAGSRLVLDALLIPLCSALALQIELDKNISCKFLPNCRFDYCIRKGEHIIGCVEAKSVKALSDTSIALAVLQLMILQTTLMATGTPKVDISEFPVFAIVTDGHRYIYIQLKGSSLGFEHDGDKVRIREVRQEGDFKDILQHIRFLVEGDKKQDDAIFLD